ncbi:hypothetical protein QI633_20235 [Nocardioides sp. QY071]|uniref:hypothetical protein n=1 Tax=Nocardioides sp. QY071 TaxID=3044187 RepID=UPI00249C2E05|nr:hypothetical protein [Nocardioides sp. QY071]WGY00856.1 hypothetical protein QI633_20235 [Nocardioides sp. QY071]
MVNLLPAVLGDVELPERVADAQLRDQLVEAWNDYQAEIAVGIAAPGLVPTNVTNALNAWVQAQNQITENSQTRRAALVLGTTEGVADSSVRVVISAIGAFEKLRHPSKADSESPVDRAAYQGALSIIENAITSRILGFFAVKQQLQDVVDAANVQTEDGVWATPSDGDVATALARIGGLQHRRIFYDQLGNPEWIVPLNGLRALEAPKALDPDAEQGWQPWPAGDYLVRMAEFRPTEVREVMLRLVDRDTAWPAKVRLLEAALRMPVSESRAMASAIRSYLSGELDPHLGLDVVTFIEQLAQADEVRLAKRLAQTLLRPRPAPNAGGRGRRDVRAGIDSYWYAEALKRVIAALRADPRLLGTVYAWLREEQTHSDSWAPDRDWDASSIWRPSISDHEQNYRHHDLADALVDALRDLAIAQIESGGDLEGVMQTLERDRMPLAMRIAMYVLSALESPPADVLQVATQRVLDRDLLHHPWFFREYTQLATATLPRLNDVDYGRWEDLVYEGPQLSDERRQRVVEHRKDEQTEEDAFREYVTMRRHELLSAVGAGALRGRLLEVHTALVEDLGEYEHAGFRSWHSISAGEEVPPVADELSTMSLENVLATLHDWEPDKSQIGTKDGLAETLRDLAESRPFEFSAQTRSFVHLNEPYRSRFLDGLRKAAESNAAAIDWPAYLLGAGDLQGLVDEEDRQNTYPLRQVCNTIESAVSGERTRIPEMLLSDAVELVAQWVDDPNPSDDDSLGSDHLTQALNTTRPVAVRTLIRIARAAKLAHSEEFDSTEVIAAVQRALVSRLDPRDPSLAVASAYGEGLSLLMWMDAAWTASWLGNAATSDTWGDVFITTALTTNTTSTQLLNDLWPSIDSILNRAAAGGPIEMGWRSNRSIDEVVGDHLMALAMWGSTSPWPERTQSYFARVDTETAASVLGQVGWRLMNTAEPAPELIERAEAIWDARQAAVDQGKEDAGELAQFYWWVHSNKFPVTWWLPRLVRVVDQIDFDGRSFIGEHIEEAAHTHPGDAVTLLLQLLRSDETRTLARHGLVTSAPKVIALGLHSADEAVQRASRALMDLLGEQGVVDMDDQVARASRELDSKRDSG